MDGDVWIDGWVSAIIDAGADLGYGTEVNWALGIAGFPSTGTKIAGQLTESDETPCGCHFDGWQNSNNKTFYAWKSMGDSDVNISYHVESNELVQTFPANTDASPTIAEYNGKLYVFWKDQTNNDIKYTLYDASQGVEGVIYSLGWADIQADGAFDSVVFGDRLYLVYTYNYEVSLSWCTSTEQGCSWNQFSDGSYRKGLGYYSFPGLGAEAGPGLNGTGQSDAEYLYVVSSSAWPFVAQIRIDQIDATENVRKTAWIPYYYRSHQTLDEIGVWMARSALPDEGVYSNYIYITWVDLDDKHIYKAIIQRFDDTSPDVDMQANEYWITMSDDTFIEPVIGTGARLKKGGGIGASIIYTDTDNDAKSSMVWGLY